MGAQPWAVLQGHPDSKCSYCLCVWTTPASSPGLLRPGCLRGGIAPFSAQEDREECWDLSFSAFWDSAGRDSVCLKCCAVSCFNKEPPGLNWAVTTWKEGAASLPKCQGPCSPTPGPSPRRVLLKTFITTKKSELPDSKFASWVCRRSERGLPPTGSALACRGPLALDWPRQRTDGWLSEDSQMACGDGVRRAGGVPPLASARSRAAPRQGAGSWSPCG